MRRALLSVLLLGALLANPSLAAPQDGPTAPRAVVVDRVAARIENDVITLSDIRELAAYQRLAGREPAGEAELLRELIDQWVVANDAAAARFPPAPPSRVDAEFEALRNQVGTPLQFAARLHELGLSEQSVRNLVARQVFLDLYLDRKFRAAVRVPPAEVEHYYNEEFIPQLQRRKQSIPPLDDVRDSITDVLTEREITRRAEQWVEQARKQLDIEIFPERRP